MNASLAVMATCNGEAVFVLDEAGCVLMPAEPAARVAIAAALAQAAARLAAEPPPASSEDVIVQVGQCLAALGTPEAATAIDNLNDAVAAHADALAAATAILTAAAPSTH